MGGRKADYMTLVRSVLRQSRTLPLPMGLPTDLRQARKDLVRAATPAPRPAVDARSPTHELGVSCRSFR